MAENKVVGERMEKHQTTQQSWPAVFVRFGNTVQEKQNAKINIDK